MTPSSLGDGAVVVGVDGSQAALNAVRWAAVEAAARDECLRLVHVVPAPGPADRVLARAARVVTSSPHAVHVETATVVGTPGEELLRESRSASMLCIGLRSARGDEREVGPTVHALARGSACPVAVIRTRADGTAHTDGVISVVLSDEADNDDVVHFAMHEGRLRRATVRQVDQRVDSWVRRYPDVHVEIVAGETGRQYRWRDATAGVVGLAVVGRTDAQDFGSADAPDGHPILGYPDCSVLLVRS